MKNERNAIFLQRKLKMILSKGSDVYEGQFFSATQRGRIVSTALSNLKELGYIVEKPVLDILLTMNISEISSWFSNTLITLKKMKGANVVYNPMYPNFPKQVMDASESELFINAMMHYIGRVVGLDLLPAYSKEDRKKLWDDNIELDNIKLGTQDEFDQMFIDLMSSKTSISPTDKEHLEWYLTNTDDPKLPEKFNHKEVQAYVFGIMIKAKKFHKISKYFKTATDVLRLAVTMSGGDESLAADTKFRNFKRSERRLILSLLNDCSGIEEDMLRYRMKWIRLGEKLHPGEYKKFKIAANAFHKIRNNMHIETFASKLEAYLSQPAYIADALQLLKSRPGEFARRLDHILRIASKETHQIEIVDTFAEVVDNVSTPVLLQVKTHFNYRNNGKDIRVIFPKGNAAKVKALPNELKPISDEICYKVVIICENALMKKFGELDELGKVYIDPKLKDQLVPFSQRSASKSLKTVVRGSKFDIGKGSTIRFFIHWKNLEEGDSYRRSVDVDLSAVMYDKDWNYKEHISYTNLRSAGYKACHSGDITNAPNGASEFIDLDIDSAIKHGCRYIMMDVLSYSRQPFNQIPECFAGWMVREDPQSGEIYEPKTVQNKIDLTAETQICVPLVLDLVERKVIWADLALKHRPNYNVNIESNEHCVALMGKSIAELVKPNLYDLFELHFEARGEELVDDPKDADTVFSLTEGITPFDIETIMGQYL